MTGEDADMSARPTTTAEPVGAVDSPDRGPRELQSEDTKLLNLVEAVLVDPNLHTDLRMRLHGEVSDLLRNTHEMVYGAAARQLHGAQTREAHRRLTGEPSTPAGVPHLPKSLEAMLVDPNLHTDMRMRLYDQIPKLIQKARQQGAASLKPED